MNFKFNIGFSLKLLIICSVLFSQLVFSQDSGGRVGENLASGIGLLNKNFSGRIPPSSKRFLPILKRASYVTLLGTCLITFGLSNEVALGYLTGKYELISIDKLSDQSIIQEGDILVNTFNLNIPVPFHYAIYLRGLVYETRGNNEIISSSLTDYLNESFAHSKLFIKRIPQKSLEQMMERIEDYKSGDKKFQYDKYSNNCQHFSNEIATGTPSSDAISGLKKTISSFALYGLWQARPSKIISRPTLTFMYSAAFFKLWSCE
jgi:hypothetical protein